MAGITCQLLNPIDESEATRLVGDAAFCLQEKLDGRRLLLERRGDTINGINRLGLFVGVPEPIAAAARKLPVDFIIDGTERRMQRPTDPVQQQDLYSGKKKRIRSKTTSLSM